MKFQLHCNFWACVSQFRSVFLWLVLKLDGIFGIGNDTLKSCACSAFNNMKIVQLQKYQNANRIWLFQAPNMLGCTIATEECVCVVVVVVSCNLLAMKNNKQKSLSIEIHAKYRKKAAQKTMLFKWWCQFLLASLLHTRKFWRAYYWLKKVKIGSLSAPTIDATVVCFVFVCWFRFSFRLFRVCCIFDCLPRAKCY